MTKKETINRINLIIKTLMYELPYKLNDEQIEKIYENIEDGTKALKEYLESKNNKSKKVSD